jgi:hypothetical protein
MSNTYLHILHLYFADTGLTNHGFYFVIEAKTEGTVSDLIKRMGKDKLQIPLLTIHYLGVYETSIIIDCKSNSKTPRNLSVRCVRRGKAHKIFTFI